MVCASTCVVVDTRLLSSKTPNCLNVEMRRPKRRLIRMTLHCYRILALRCSQSYAVLFCMLSVDAIYATMSMSLLLDVVDAVLCRAVPCRCRECCVCPPVHCHPDCCSDALCSCCASDTYFDMILRGWMVEDEGQNAKLITTKASEPPCVRTLCAAKLKFLICSRHTAACTLASRSHTTPCRWLTPSLTAAGHSL